MSRAREVYPNELLELARDRSRRGKAEPTTHRGHAKNPLCGDQLDVTLCIQNDTIIDARFQARGCAIAQASATLMSRLIEGESKDGALSLSVLLDGVIAPQGPTETDPRFAAFYPLRNVRSRRRCATLAWEALRRAIDHS